MNQQTDSYTTNKQTNKQIVLTLTTSRWFVLSSNAFFLSVALVIPWYAAPVIALELRHSTAQHTRPPVRHEGFRLRAGAHVRAAGRGKAEMRAVTVVAGAQVRH